MSSVRDPLLVEIETLYRKRFPHFVRVARAVVGDRERAVEAVQDGFANAISRRDSFRREGTIEAWVWRAVVNAARKAARRPLVEVHEGRSDAGDPATVLPEVAPLIAALPERQRLALFLRYYADLDYRAIADALDVEVGTVSATLAAAHAAVRNSLEVMQSNG
jgi:RNA polymerase sigma-70 factor (ECF subfamily)